MEDEATQPSTQYKLDPRRAGRRSNSGLNESDISDVLCILVPASPAAHEIVNTTAQLNPQHILQNHGINARVRDSPLVGAVGGSSTERETVFFESMDDDGPRDIALRFSSRVNNPALGFCFGRNTMKCDINLDAKNLQKRVSNTHFRIYVKASNGSGIIMLEDVSTNGTVVDGSTLGGKRGNNDMKTRMLGQGSIIEILAINQADLIKFMVRIPPREGHLPEYTAKFQAYMEHVQIAEQRQKAAKEGLPIPEAAERGMLAAPLAGPPNTKSIPTVNPPGMNNDFGINWTGGDEYSCIGILGKGAFAIVYQMAAKKDGEIYAVKELEKRRFVKNGVLDRRLETEMKIMKDLRHPNIVQYVKYQETTNHLYIVMEYVSGGDLQGYIQAHGTVPEPHAKLMSKQILGALGYLHKKDITHRDIKPDNILIASEDPFTTKLTDFGLSKVVKNDETFLKTFCGTLLYCAPEVFPHYEAHMTGQRQKRRRQNEPPIKNRYNHSVDIWSFAAVLWLVLCTKPPYEGVTDANGKGMFTRIMETSLDPTPLREHSVSEECIDLLIRMLNTDPASRPLESTCLAHPWLTDGKLSSPDAAFRGLAVIPEGEEELDASKLSIQERPNDSKTREEDIVNMAGSDQDGSQPQSKRHKPERFIRLPRESEIESSSEMSLNPIPLVDDLSHIQFPLPATSKPNRLFGEIGSSALRSSGVLGGSLREMIPNEEGEEDELAMDEGQPQHPQNKTWDENNAGIQINVEGEPTQHPTAQNISAAASLLGAESLVRELNMESPNPGSSAAQAPEETEDPKTPPRSQAQAVSNDEAPHAQGGQEEVTPKQPSFSRQINLPVSASLFYDPHDPTTHNLEYASRVSGLNFLNESTVSNIGITSLPETVAPSFQSAASAEPHTVDRTNTPDNGQNKENEQQAPTLPQLTAPSLEFLKPPPRLGRLVSTPDSFTALTLSLSQRVTFWGRNPGNTLIYHDGHDTRVPKCGLEVWFHAKGIEDAEAAGRDWTKMPDLAVFVRTHSRHGIRVNGVPLAEHDERGRMLFGRLFTGDEVRVTPGERGAGLEFVCEFFHGLSAQRRGEEEPRFAVQVVSSGSSVTGGGGGGSPEAAVV